MCVSPAIHCWLSYHPLRLAFGPSESVLAAEGRSDKLIVADVICTQLLYLLARPTFPKRYSSILDSSNANHYLTSYYKLAEIGRSEGLLERGWKFNFDMAVMSLLLSGCSLATSEIAPKATLES